MFGLVHRNYFFWEEGLHIVAAADDFPIRAYRADVIIMLQNYVISLQRTLAPAFRHLFLHTHSNEGC